MPPVARIYSCASGCGFTSEDPSALRKCSKCKLARYCCRDHQMLHWKKGHKAECFPPEAQNSQIIGQFCLDSDSTPQDKATLAARSALGGRSGAALFVGTSRQQGRKVKIITDVWDIEDCGSNSSDEQVPPDLYLSHIPPALLCKAEDTWIANPKISMIDAATQRLCHRFWSDPILSGNLATFQQVVSSKPFACALKAALREERRGEAVQCIREQLQSVDWTLQIPVPARIQEQAKSLVGKPLTLKGGIEMVYLTEPVPCFADLTKSQMDWFNKKASPLPMVKSPIVVYCCVKEGWVMGRVNPRLHLPFPLDPATNFTSFDKDAMFLKMFVAAAEFRDVTAIYAAWTPAKKFAVAQKQEHVFIQAAQKLLKLLLEIHPQPQREEAYFLHDLGEVHESRASWLIRAGQDATEELLSAARCYHLAAARTHQFSPNYFIRFTHYHSLGITLLRLDYPEMAKRAFFWSLTDPCAWMTSSDECCKRGTIITSLNSWWDGNQMTQAERKKVNRIALKDQRSQLKKCNLSDGHYKSRCAHCDKSLQENRQNEQHCARCLAPYCSRGCQQSDWPAHKKICKQAQNDSTAGASLSFDETCSDATRALLDAVDWTKMKSTMSLAEGARRADEWQQPERMEIRMPQWMVPESELSL